MQRDNNGRGEKIALPSARPLPLIPEIEPLTPEPELVAEAVVVTEPVPEPEPQVIPIRAAAVVPAPAPEPPPPPPLPEVAAAAIAPDEAETRPLPPTRWQYEPPEDLELLDAEAAEEFGVLLPPPPPPAPPAPALLEESDEDALEAHAAAVHHEITPPTTGSSFEAALESLQRRMDRAKLTTDFVRSLLIVDNVIDVGEAAMRWAGMPNKHERSLTSEVFFALAEWGFLAPRADGRYRVLHSADDDPLRCNMRFLLLALALIAFGSLSRPKRPSCSRFTWACCPTTT